ncbi:hypothetical protein ALP36_04790, partial [Pseudomonas syringae pv. coriandricola]
HPPDQRQDSAVTYVAICVVNAIVVEKHIKNTVVRIQLSYRRSAWACSS